MSTEGGGTPPLTYLQRLTRRFHETPLPQRD
jgi:hypothetical protein